MENIDIDSIRYRYSLLFPADIDIDIRYFFWLVLILNIRYFFNPVLVLNIRYFFLVLSNSLSTTLFFLLQGNGAFQKGMPHKSYHGKTGRVFNVSKHAVGIIVNKRVGGRIIPKRVSIRVEHIKHSACRTDFLNRVKNNELLKKEAKAAGKEAPHCKRMAKAPLGAHLVKSEGKEPEFLAPIPYEFVA